jgi:hypothetical protein
MQLRRLISILLVVTPLLRGGEVLDRIIATVNGHAILESDWNDELRYECFMSGRSIRDLSAEDRRAAFERLIDQELLRDQMASDFKPVATEKVNAQLNQLKQQYAHDHNGQVWTDALSSYGTSESELAAHIAIELNSLRLVDERLRPSIQIDAAEIQDYYNKQLLPKLPKDQHISLQEATPKIRELLVEQKMNELLNSWLQSLRSQAQIRIVAPEIPRAQVQP